MLVTGCRDGRVFDVSGFEPVEQSRPADPVPTPAPAGLL